MSNSANLLALDAKLVFDLAAQVHPPHIVAAEHGLDPQYLAEVMELPHVKKLIKEKRRELDEAGFSLVTKSKLILEDLVVDIYRKAKDPGSSLSSLLEAAKFFRTMSGLDKQDPNVQAQERFSININFGGGKPPPVTIDAKSQTVTIGELPEAPAFLVKETPQILSDLHYVEEA